MEKTFTNSSLISPLPITINTTDDDVKNFSLLFLVENGTLTQEEYDSITHAEPDSLNYYIKTSLYLKHYKNPKTKGKLGEGILWDFFAIAKDLCFSSNNRNPKILKCTPDLLVVEVDGETESYTTLEDWRG